MKDSPINIRLYKENRNKIIYIKSYNSVKKRKTMKKCNTLEEVRTEIDSLDTRLVDLISERSHLIRQAAGFKQSVEEVKAQDRIDFILQRARHHAIEKGVSPNMISELFSIMIDEMVETEIAEFRNTSTF